LCKIWNYTPGWLGEFSPYYQTGIHASYRFNDHWSGELLVLKGWQLIKIEARRDHSTAAVFGSSRNETIVVAGAVTTF
jgi:hypothetical protein